MFTLSIKKRIGVIDFIIISVVFDQCLIRVEVFNKIINFVFKEIEFIRDASASTV